MRVMILLSVALLSASVVTASAQQKRPQVSGNLIADIKANNAAGVSPIAGVQALVDAFEKVELGDLKVARAYADSENDQAATSCYDAWIDQVERLARVRDENPAGDGPQLITAFQKARNLVKRLDTDSPLRMACAALAADAKGDVKQFIGSLLSGAALKALSLP